ncbi:MAG TPA: 5-oxoprolinase subunit PxpA [Chloroflexota bacterium]|nr:5-oxoprolinase subunit PxpA [Chloroflexota bacterium]
MAERTHIDLNADLGEWSSAQGQDADQALLALISSANVACGFHAGGPQTMQATVERAAALGCAIGAHPSYPDPAGFGRRFLDATPDEIYADVLYQIGALSGFCRATGAALVHVKAHGALYNRAAVEARTAGAIARAVRAFDPRLLLMAPPDSVLLQAGRDAGLTVLAEVFADRAYNADGTLVSRRLPGAMIDEPREAARRALRMAREGLVTAIDGTEIALEADTICLHGDAPGAVERARAIRAALDAAGIHVAARARDTGA